ncbi:hypothetical protein, partial [Pseudomonas sp. EL_65y_Pfl2_R96]|uniref:hypothetical protein n=1 Tax=Pseudomonas sp. EL_65y_Pfl2_R96 TaxID=3088699 RepID=UPI0030D6F3C9
KSRADRGYKPTPVVTSDQLKAYLDHNPFIVLIKEKAIMTDEIQTDAAAGLAAQTAAVIADASPPTLEDVEARRNAENLEKAKAGGYVEPAEPSISERVAMLVAGVQHAIDHNSPISREHFAELKALLGYRNSAEPPEGVQTA